VAAGLVAFGCSGPGGKPVTPEPKEPSVAETSAPVKEPAAPIKTPAAPEQKAPKVAPAPERPPVAEPKAPERVGTGPVVPANLPKPDGKPGAQDKPVKVYILAGQSNMVGFGRYSGSAPLYNAIYLSADPAVKPRNLGMGKAAILPHRVYQNATGDARGAKGYVYHGVYDAKADYSKKKPVKESIVHLGTVAEYLPAIKAPHIVVVKGFIEVPMTGPHEAHAGLGASADAVVTLDGKTVYSKDPGAEPVLESVTLESGKRHPITITYMQSGSATFWMKLSGLKGKGDLQTLIKGGKYKWFADEEGKWTVRNDVIYWDVRLSKEEIGSGGPLKTTSNGKFIGPEVPFGYVMGAFHDEQVLLIESSIGNRALCFDFRPPSSGRPDPDNKFEGLEYRLMVEGAHKALKNLDKVIPGYQGQGYEIVGFVWWQGHKDGGKPKEEYEKHLVNLIQDLRKEFKAPEMRAVVATVGFGGWKMGENYAGVHAAQMAVGDPRQHPEFAGKVASVDTRGYWRDQGESPTGTGYHYNHNAETYVLTGDTMGRAMVGLLGGRAERLPGARPKPEGDAKKLEDMTLQEMAVLVHTDAFASAYAQGELEPSAEDIKAMGPALWPIILQDMLTGYVTAMQARPPRKGQLSLVSLLKGDGPACNPGDGSLKCEFDEILARYNMAEVRDFDWKPFGPIAMNSEWNYFSFDPAEKQDLKITGRGRKVTFPAGMEAWMKPKFDAAGAGWKRGAAPFGQKDGVKKPLTPGCTNKKCGCGAVPATMWEKEVLLLQQTFNVPPLKDGHLYRIVLGGAQHRRKGEGYTIYINGKPLAEAKAGYLKRMNGPRGAYITSDFVADFKSGKVTIAVKAFLRYTHFRNGTKYWGSDPEYRGKDVPPNGNISLWLEEAKLPEVVLKNAPGK